MASRSAPHARRCQPRVHSETMLTLTRTRIHAGLAKQDPRNPRPRSDRTSNHRLTQPFHYEAEHAWHPSYTPRTPPTEERMATSRRCNGKLLIPTRERHANKTTPRIHTYTPKKHAPTPGTPRRRTYTNSNDKSQSHIHRGNSTTSQQNTRQEREVLTKSLVKQISASHSPLHHQLTLPAILPTLRLKDQPPWLPLHSSR